MSQLVEHAQRELELCGQMEQDPAYAQSILAAVAAFSSYGHSGGSHSCAVAHLTELLNFRTLSPLTNNPQEWMLVVEHPPLWQSRRNPESFSTDGGKTYYSVGDAGPNRADPQPTKPYLDPKGSAEGRLTQCDGAESGA